MRNEVKNLGLPQTKESCWTYFIQKSSNNLHIVLAMSPAGENLRRRCRNFPGLVNCTVIDWFMPWPKQALHAVGKAFLTEVSLVPESHRDQVVEHVVFVHLSVSEYSQKYLEKWRRVNHVTPKNYLDFIHSYSGIWLSGSC